MDVSTAFDGMATGIAPQPTRAATLVVALIRADVAAYTTSIFGTSIAAASPTVVDS